MSRHVSFILQSNVAAVLMLCGSAEAIAQRDDRQAWLQINTIIPLSDNLRLTLEQIARGSERQDGLYQSEVGGLLGWRASRHVELGFGYRRVGAYNGNTAADEDRLRQQVVVSAGPFVSRLRLDERLRAGGGEIGFRLRPLVRYNRRLGTAGPRLFLSHESFYLINGTAWGQRRGYERMRNIAGVTLPLGRGVSADIGYLNQYRFSRGSSPAQMDHAFTVQVAIDLGAKDAPRVHD